MKWAQEGSELDRAIYQQLRRKPHRGPQFDSMLWYLFHDTLYITQIHNNPTPHQQKYMLPPFSDPYWSELHKQQQRNVINGTHS